MDERSKAIFELLDNAGVPYSITQGGKHQFVEWIGINGPRKQTIFTTSSDWRSVENARHEVRDWLEEDGLLVENRAAIVSLRDGRGVASSLDIAAHFKKSHKDVLRAYDRLISDISDQDFTGRNFALSSYKDPSGRSLRSIDMTRDGFSLLAMGFTGQEAAKWKIKYIAAFNQLEEQKLRNVEYEDRLAKIEARCLSLEDENRALTDLLLEQRAPIALPAPKPKNLWFMQHQMRRKLRRAAA